MRKEANIFQLSEFIFGIDLQCLFLVGQRKFGITRFKKDIAFQWISNSRGIEIAFMYHFSSQSNDAYRNTSDTERSSKRKMSSIEIVSPQNSKAADYFDYFQFYAMSWFCLPLSNFYLIELISRYTHPLRPNNRKKKNEMKRFVHKRQKRKNWKFCFEVKNVCAVLCCFCFGIFF